VTPRCGNPLADSHTSLRNHLTDILHYLEYSLHGLNAEKAPAPTDVQCTPWEIVEDRGSVMCDSWVRFAALNHPRCLRSRRNTRMLIPPLSIPCRGPICAAEWVERSETRSDKGSTNGAGWLLASSSRWRRASAPIFGEWYLRSCPPPEYLPLLNISRLSVSSRSAIFCQRDPHRPAVGAFAPHTAGKLPEFARQFVDA
jgi:hypothetical protein